MLSSFPEVPALRRVLSVMLSPYDDTRSAPKTQWPAFSRHVPRRATGIAPDRTPGAARVGTTIGAMVGADETPGDRAAGAFGAADVGGTRVEAGVGWVVAAGEAVEPQAATRADRRVVAIARRTRT